MTDIASPPVPQSYSAGEKIPEQPQPIAENKGKGIVFTVSVDTSTNRSNVNIGFANPDVFIDFVVNGLKAIADSFHVKVTAEKIHVEERPMSAAEL